MKKKFKKAVAVILTMAMAMSVAGPAFATVKNDITLEKQTNDLSKYGITGYSQDEMLAMQYTDEYGNRTIVTYTENDGENVYYNYYNGALTEIVNLNTNEGYYQTYAVQDNNRNTIKALMKVDLNIGSVKKSMDNSLRYADDGEEVRLGYVNYELNATDIFSVYCYYKQWAEYGITEPIPTSWSSLAACVAFFVGSLALPTKIGNEIVQGLISAGVLGIFGMAIEALVSTRVEVTALRQEIYGVGVSDPDEPTLHIDTGYVYHVSDSESRYYGETFYEGHTSRDWGKSSFGSIILMIVYGLNVAPTSWSS